MSIMLVDALLMSSIVDLYNSMMNQVILWGLITCFIIKVCSSLAQAVII